MKIPLYTWLPLIASGLILGGASCQRVENLPYNATSPMVSSTSDNEASSTVRVNTPSELVTEFPQELSTLGYSPNYSEITPTTQNASNLKNIEKSYGISLSTAETNYLNKNKFVLLPLLRSNIVDSLSFDEMLQSFDRIGGSDLALSREPQNARFITPDIALHAYHRFFEMTLEQLEAHELNNTLKQFLNELSSNLSNRLKTSSPELKDSYGRLLAQITVARVLLENQVGPKPSYFESGVDEDNYAKQDKTIDTLSNAQKIFAQYSNELTPDLRQAVKTELASIYAAKSFGKSPLFGIYNDQLTTDYTQFTPRSHYTKSSALRAYFRTMMYLGRSSYTFKKDIGFKDSNLLVKEFTVTSTAGIAPIVAWKNIMDTTGFYAGQSDDLTYTEWMQFLHNTLHKDNPTANELADESTIKNLSNNMSALRLPKILSDVIEDENVSSQTKNDLLRKTLGLRIFGQRFTFDAAILNNLTAGNEKTEVRLPSSPTALLLPAAFGNTKAAEEVKTWLHNQAFSSDDQNNFVQVALKAQTTNLQKIKAADWLGSLQSAWFYVLSSLAPTFGKGYPAYMQATPFAAKQIQTFLGSYTELKHDTLLYAKQSYAEKGGGPIDGIPPAVPKGFVEPNVLFWRKLLFLIEYNEKLFASHNLFQDQTALARLQEFKKIITFYRDLAEKELQNATITDDEYEKLRNTDLSFMADPLDSTQSDATEDTAKVGLVADIHTDTLNSQILYEANAQPYLMLTLVGNDSSPRAVIGLAYNHYEFNEPINGNRLTDEVWKKRAYNTPPQLPVKNPWYSSLSVK